MLFGASDPMQCFHYRIVSVINQLFNPFSLGFGICPMHTKISMDFLNHLMLLHGIDNE